ncbi:MAG: hypothetical protein AAAB13_05925 [Pseudomonas sp.]
MGNLFQHRLLGVMDGMRIMRVATGVVDPFRGAIDFKGITFEFEEYYI